MSRIAHFINLTNGIEAIKEYNLNMDKISFIRIQSTWCEQKLWDDILFTLSDDFLMKLALGYHCIIYDYSNKKTKPRAIKQGVEWIKYAIIRNWFDETYSLPMYLKSAQPYFKQQYKLLSKKTHKKLRYFKKFLLTDKITIETVSWKTVLDGKYDKYKEILKMILEEKDVRALCRIV